MDSEKQINISTSNSFKIRPFKNRDFQWLRADVFGFWNFGEFTHRVSSAALLAAAEAARSLGESTLAFTAELDGEPVGYLLASDRGSLSLRTPEVFTNYARRLKKRLATNDFHRAYKAYTDILRTLYPAESPSDADYERVALLVPDEYRGLGIAHSLVAKFEELLRNNGKKSYAVSSAVIEGSHFFDEGFKTVGESKVTVEVPSGSKEIVCRRYVREI